MSLNWKGFTDPVKLCFAKLSWSVIEGCYYWTHWPSTTSNTIGLPHQRGPEPKKIWPYDVHLYFYYPSLSFRKSWIKQKRGSFVRFYFAFLLPDIVIVFFSVNFPLFPLKVGESRTQTLRKRKRYSTKFGTDSNGLDDTKFICLHCPVYTCCSFRHDRLTERP